MRGKTLKSKSKSTAKPSARNKKPTQLLLIPGEGGKSRKPAAPVRKAVAKAGAEDLRQASVRFQIPPAQAVARAAGHRHFCGRDVRPTDHRKADRGHFQDRQGAPSAPLRNSNRHAQERAGDRARSRGAARKG